MQRRFQNERSGEEREAVAGKSEMHKKGMRLGDFVEEEFLGEECHLCTGQSSTPLP